MCVVFFQMKWVDKFTCLIIFCFLYISFELALNLLPLRSTSQRNTSPFCGFCSNVASQTEWMLKACPIYFHVSWNEGDRHWQE